ncbi:MAG: enolase C-terminal domain-like protein [Bacteroidales bacterium]|jgi:L-alanine-DL-glutamate epimerase-like enolase superfamily enzyme|nr:twin-arginine translocation signal domain-containing protein [Bacteroidales bacterium]MDD2263663.1 enolase C-terminal domain-like protein [Bacteroidales bacterium]MDD2830546.1 enolase C-terminal domain-like protein [Bacteroidales bacterium]MDD3208815.1 enolase C-terminal domain-like protein [Bacteroidales bacterium]MDD3697460.1 enolase C-terminal domain-like protein [Bacteroidales bacterium]
MKSSRRDFLKTSMALAAVAAVTSPARLFAAETKKSLQTKGASGTDKMVLTFEPFEARMKHVFTISGSSRSTTPIVLTRIAYQGYVGYGEASMPPYLGESTASVMDFLRRVDLSRFSSPFQMEEILTYVDNITTNNTAAKCAVDIALHDLCGKIMGQPWWKIWGWSNKDLPSTCVTVGLAYASDGSIDKEEVRKKTLETLDYNLIKVKLGNTEENDKTMINTIREVTDLPIVVDANQGWKEKGYALAMIEWLARRGVQMVEQPMPKLMLDETVWLRDRSPLPIMADEACQRLSDVHKLYGAYDGINIKLMKCTGMREAREMITLARALHMRIMMGCMTETSVAISAAAQFASQLEWADLDGNWLIANDIFTGMKVVDGHITLEDKPGIGVEPL